MTELERFRRLSDMIARGNAHANQNLAELNFLGPTIAKGDPLVLAPAGRLALRAVRDLESRGGRVVALCDLDENKIGTEVCGVPIMSYQDCYRLFPAATLLVASSIHDSPITESCRELGFERICSYAALAHSYPDIFGTKEFVGLTAAIFEPGALDRVCRLFEELADDESRRVLVSKIEFYLTARKQILDDIRSPHGIYFDPAIVSINNDTIFVDGGAFKGDTLSDFLRVGGKASRKYIAFEPDPLCFEDLSNTATVLGDRFVHLRAGLHSSTGTLRLIASGSGDSHVQNAGDSDAGETISIDVVALDDYFADKEPPTFIKMDIEGSERAALAGGAGTITGSRPQLAISVYHSPSDLWDIPLSMIDMLPKARIYLRHYTRELCDTVCYAIPD